MIPLRCATVDNSTYMLQSFRTLTQRCCPNIFPPVACHHMTSFPRSLNEVWMSARCPTSLFIIVKNTLIDVGLTTSERYNIPYGGVLLFVYVICRHLLDVDALSFFSDGLRYYFDLVMTTVVAGNNSDNEKQNESA